MKEEILNRPTSIIISGVENDRYFSIVNGANIETMLMSYLYLRRKGKKFLAERIAENPNVKFLIDSGAHTFLTNDEYKDKPIEYWEDYLEKYTKFLRENKDHIFAGVELDITSIVGQDKVDEWREKYFEPLEKEGVLVCYVWHLVDGEKKWEEMCRKYDYVGFSTEVVEQMSHAQITKMFNIAKKYNARVHGFAITSLEYMTKFPFYTIDSTTWLVGTQFGEVNYFDGRRMKRLKKDEWKRTYKNKLIKLGADWDLASREDPYELIRINLLVFKEVEKYVRRVNRTRMYWIDRSKEGLSMDNETFIEQLTSERPKLTVVEARELLPPKEWFYGDMADYIEYCDKLAINSESRGEDECKALLAMFYGVLNNDLAFLKDKFNLGVLYDYASSVSGENVNTETKMQQTLFTFISKHLTGEIDTLYNPKEATEEPQIQAPKEREEYLTEEEYTLVDLEEEELQKLLPEKVDYSMPEVEAYDKELESQGIVIVRDEKGRFLKGQKKVRKPKNIYSELYPKLACDTCYKAGDCPQYKPGYVCAYHKLFKRFDSRNIADVFDAMSSMINMNLERLQFARMMEIMDGGMITPEVSALIDQNMKLLATMKDLMDNTPRTILSQKRVVKSDGTEEVYTEVNTNPQEGGILAKLFESKLQKNSNETKTSNDSEIKADYEIKE